ncbi:MAG: TIR domain-containing protein [Oscillospiraceae bacterium]|nr:TIR domain-containing protein [Oscillospiraceae bacterium]
MSEERSYIAFISYRHKPLDAKAARMIEKRIESYRIPKELRKTPDSDRLGYVFRDEDELPLSSSLSDSILRALDRSQFLIVICTPDLPQSKWCEQEIRYFLQTHDRDHLLAVLADGSGEVSFSPLMLHEYDESGNAVSDIEPLAANIVGKNHRISLRKYRKESLRLLACLLGCSFDTLYQREKRARTTRMLGAGLLVFAVLAAFGAYAAVKANQIAQHQRQIAEQAQIIVREQSEKISSQAQLLAEQAQEAFGERDYSKAVNLALLSLQLSDEDPAQHAALKRLLLSCLNLYTRPEEASTIAVPTGMLADESEAEIQDFFLNSDGSRLFVLSDKKLSVWDTADCSLLCSYESGDVIRSVDPFDAGHRLLEARGRLILWTDTAILCYAYETGELLWEAAFDPTARASGTALLSADHERLYSVCCVSPTAVRIDELDLSDGSALRTHVFPCDAFRNFRRARAVSADGDLLAFTGNNGRMMRTLTVFDLKEDTVSELVLGPVDPWNSTTTEQLCFDADARVLVFDYNGPVNIRRSVTPEYFLDMVGQKSFRIWSCDPKSGNVVWSYDSASAAEPAETLSASSDGDTVMGGASDLRGLKAPLILQTEISGLRCVAAAVGNSLWVLEADSGVCRMDMLFDAAIVVLEQREQALDLILENGHRVMIPKELDTAEIVTVKNFPPDIIRADHSGSFFYIQTEASQIVQYTTGKSDPSYMETKLTGQSVRAYMDSLPADDRILESGGHQLTYGEGKTSFAILPDVTIPVQVGEEIQAMSFTPDGSRILVGLQRRVLLYDLEGTLLSTTELPDTIRAYSENAYLYFPEASVCLYGSLFGGYLLDLFEDSAAYSQYINKAVAFDHNSDQFLVCDYYAYDPNDCGFILGSLNYHSMEEILALAAGIGL